MTGNQRSEKTENKLSILTTASSSKMAELISRETRMKKNWNPKNYCKAALKRHELIGARTI